MKVHKPKRGFEPASFRLPAERITHQANPGHRCFWRITPALKSAGRGGEVGGGGGGGARASGKYTLVRRLSTAHTVFGYWHDRLSSSQIEPPIATQWTLALSRCALHC